MQVLTKQQVLKKIETFCQPYATFAAAAKTLGCTPAQLSDARNDRTPVPPAILKKLGIERASIYVVDLDSKYLDGAMAL